MRATNLLILIILLSALPLGYPIEGQGPESLEGWEGRESYVIDYGNGTHATTQFIGPQVFWDSETSQWLELKFEDRGTYYLIENAHITAYIYPWYTVFYDPDNKRVAVDDERWIVEILANNGKWREVDLYAPTLSHSNNATHLTVSRVFDTSEGFLNITYIVWKGSNLKHEVIFTSRMSGLNEYRVVMKMSGIRGNKIKDENGRRQITGEEHLLTPMFQIGEDDTSLVLSEYLWALGEENETTFEWEPTTLLDVVVDTHARGSKVDILIGIYPLTEGESLLIDPDTDTWIVTANTDDAIKRWKDGAADWSTSKTTGYTGYISATIDRAGAGFRFRSITIPNGATIDEARLKLYSYDTNANDDVNSIIAGEDVDDAATFSTLVNFDARDRTTATVNWDVIGHWSINTWYDSPDIKTIIQEIVDRGGWASGQDLVIFWDDWDDRSDQVNGHYRRYDHKELGGGGAPRLMVIWTEGGEVYLRDLDVDLLWAETLFRPWTLTRGLDIPLTVLINAARGWTLTRVMELPLTLTIDVWRGLSAAVAYVRDLTLDLVLTVNAEVLRVLASGYLLFTVQVVDRFDVALAEADVSVWIVGGTHSFSDVTNSTGFTDPGRNVTSANYTVMVSKDDYFPAQVAVGLTHDHILKVVLSTYVINIEVALLALIAVGFAIFHLRSSSIPSGLISSTFSFGTVLIWLGARSPVPALAWLFAIFGAVILISTGRSFIEWWGDSRREW